MTRDSDHIRDCILGESERAAEWEMIANAG